jgi:hypothetical protein
MNLVLWLIPGDFEQEKLLRVPGEIGLAAMIR